MPIGVLSSWSDWIVHQGANLQRCQVVLELVALNVVLRTRTRQVLSNSEHQVTTL